MSAVRVTLAPGSAGSTIFADIHHRIDLEENRVSEQCERTERNYQREQQGQRLWYTAEQEDIHDCTLQWCKIRTPQRSLVPVVCDPVLLDVAESAV